MSGKTNDPYDWLRYDDFRSVHGDGFYSSVQKTTDLPNKALCTKQDIWCQQLASNEAAMVDTQWAADTSWIIIKKTPDFFYTFDDQYRVITDRTQDAVSERSGLRRCCTDKKWKNKPLRSGFEFCLKVLQFSSMSLMPIIQISTRSKWPTATYQLVRYAEL